MLMFNTHFILKNCDLKMTVVALSALRVKRNFYSIQYAIVSVVAASPENSD